ncbi:hypothetical protein [Pseudoxanthomonas suwonensis]|uniref:hypothetical protein n=1 Tax=Pseudoxanthomonas suwonensis TaxID=314722 RepID=UPI0012DDB66B|nr:hypothetical protein [Pseudoxanthomonas suwonensis]
MDAFERNTASEMDNDASLLEGLFQLAVSGHTEGWEYEHLAAEVYQRLEHAYAVEPQPH